MIERAWPMHVRQSVFTKLVAIMLGMAAVLLVLVLAFVLLYLGPVMNASINGVVHEYVHTVATTAPTYQRAKEIGDRLDVQTRYDGPDGAWATDDKLPTIAEARRHERGSFSGRHYYVTSAPNGGTYLFAFRLGERMRTAHIVVPAVVLLLIATVVFAAHAVLKRVLLPVRWLADGVARLSEGDLAVAVPTRSGDEFGALTDAFNRMVGRVREMIGARDPESVVPPVFRQSKSNSPQPEGCDEGLRRRLGLRLRRTLRALERQHPYARPAFVNRQKRASLDVLTVCVEGRGDDAHGAIREQVLRAELHHARPVDGTRREDC